MRSVEVLSAKRRPARGRSNRQNEKLSRALALGISLLFVLPILFVFFWMVSMSFKTQVEISSASPTLFPLAPTLTWYQDLLTRMPFGGYFLNSLIVGVGSTGLGLAFGLPAAYAIARWKLTGASTAVLITRIIPAISYLIPWFIVAKRVGLTDSLFLLILLHLTVTLPLIIWIMIGFFESLPDELEQAARVDGCSTWQSFIKIALPLVQPGLVAASILAFISSWNNFLFAAVLGGPNSQTLPVVVYNLLSFEQANWGPLAAGATLVCLPIVLATLFFQRYLVEGLTAGAVKG